MIWYFKIIKQDMQDYHIIVIGCQMNKADSERLAAYLDSLGWQAAEKVQAADYVFLVTCGVRQTAEDRVYGLVKQLKRDNKKAKIILTGCLSDRVDVKERLADKVDLFFNITDLPDLANKLGIKTEVGSNGGYLALNAKYQSAYSAYVPIGNGCNNFCAYCVVPYARGTETYRPYKEILKEVKHLINKGYKEIILIAQNVNSYYSDPSLALPFARGGKIVEKFSETLFTPASKDSMVPPPYEGGGQEGVNLACPPARQGGGLVDFPDLLKMIDDLPGNFWLRFSTSHPKDLSDKLIDIVTQGQKICQHFHVAVQSGDNEILQAMNRQYTVEHYLSLVKKIRCQMPEASLTTDIIVGFPGESQKQFLNSQKLVKAVNFSQVYIGQYSPRFGTAAARLTDDVSAEEKKRRAKILDKTLRPGALAFNQKFIGQTIKVLVDEVRSLLAYGKNAQFVRVTFPKTEAIKVGQFVDIKINKAKDFGLRGEILE